MTPIAFTTLTWVFIVIPLLVIYALGIVDILRRDMPGGTKAAWIILVVILPVAGTIAYFVMRKPTEKEIRQSQAASSELRREMPRGAKRKLPGE